MRTRALIKAAAVGTSMWLIASADSLAADLPAGPPPASVVYAAPPTYNWSGFYIGINGGYGHGTTNWTSATGATGDFNAAGPLAGGTVGINYQAGSFVFGFEADADWADFTGTSNNATVCSLFTPNAGCETKQTWFGTGRARIGYAFDRLLVFGTAGGAVGNIRAGLVPPNTFDTATAVGWTVGGGLEAGITENWSIKVEYLYADYGNGSCSANCGPFVPITVPLTENLIRAGINYRLPF